MALTYEQHKAAIDIAYPTPPIEWVRLDDHVNYGHPEVATVALTFNAVAYHYLRIHLPRARRGSLEDSTRLGRPGPGGCSRRADVLG